MICASRRTAVVLAAALASIIASPAGADPKEYYSLDPDRREAIRIERVAFERSSPALRERNAALMVRNYASTAPKSEMSYVTGVQLLEPDAVGRSWRAIVMRYDYPTGLTFRSLVDLKKGKVVEPIEADANYPAPLAPQEIELAARLAKVSPTNASMLTLVDDAPSSKTHGHRLVVVSPNEPGRKTRLLVNLTTQHIIKHNY